VDVAELERAAIARPGDIRERSLSACEYLERDLPTIDSERDRYVIADADPHSAVERVAHGDRDTVRRADRELRVRDPPHIAFIEARAAPPVDGREDERDERDDDGDREEGRRRAGEGERDRREKEQAEQAGPRDGERGQRRAKR
jgi:hypothetical protein